MHIRTTSLLVLYTAYNDLYCASVWLEKGFESLFSVVEFEAVGNQLLQIDEFTTQQVCRI